MPGSNDQLLLDPGTFSRYREMYRRIVANYEGAEAGVRDAQASIYHSEQLVAQSDATPEIRAKAEVLLSQARTLLAEAQAFSDQAAQLRIRTLAQVVAIMGDNLNQIKKWRAKVTLGEIGFAPGFDSDLAGLEQRYLAVYRASFPIMAEGVTKIPDAREWGEQEWAEWESVEAPMFFWDIQQCRDLWRYPLVTECEGPDLAMSFSLINQINEAWKNQVDMIKEFPIIGLLDWTLGGHLEEGDEAVAAADKVFRRITAVLKDVAKIIEKTVRALATTPGILLVGGAVALFLLSRKK